MRELLQASVERDAAGFYIVTFADGRQTYTKHRSKVLDMAEDLRASLDDRYPGSYRGAWDGGAALTIEVLR